MWDSPIVTCNPIIKFGYTLSASSWNIPSKSIEMSSHSTVMAMPIDRWASVAPGARKAGMVHVYAAKPLRPAFC